MDKEKVKDYIKYIADQRLKLIGFKPNFGIEENPLPFMGEITSTVLTNFFEGKVTEYARGALTGSWEELKNAVK
jgi:ribonucleoside-diphosphate reductase beta chain